jgi:hypothetical protein
MHVITSRENPATRPGNSNKYIPLPGVMVTVVGYPGREIAINKSYKNARISN